MRRLDELETAIFDERNVAASQLDLQPSAVMCRTEQYCLMVQFDPGLALFQRLARDKDGLSRLVLDCDQIGQFGRRF